MLNSEYVIRSNNDGTKLLRLVAVAVNHAFNAINYSGVLEHCKTDVLERCRVIIVLVLRRVREMEKRVTI